MALLKTWPICGLVSRWRHGVTDKALNSKENRFAIETKQLTAEGTEDSRRMLGEMWSLELLLRLVFFPFDQLVTIENVLLRDHAFEFAEVGAVNNGQNW